MTDTTKTKSYRALREERDAFLAALEGLFEHCVMIHKHWGEGSNNQEADAAQATALALIARIKKTT